MALRHVTDNWRATLSSLAALPASFAVSYGALGAADREAGTESLLALYLPFWPIYAGLYLLWTHLVYSRGGPQRLEAAARIEGRSRSRWWGLLLGGTDGSSLTLVGAVVAVLITVSISQVESYRSDVVFVVLGLVTVASSWALMVYSFALDYLRLDRRLRREGRSHIAFHTGDEDGDSTFGDYLTFAVLASTMAATISADVGSRAVWRLVRTHVLVAFAFNSVVVAMVVSLLFGGLVG